MKLKDLLELIKYDGENIVIDDKKSRLITYNVNAVPDNLKNDNIIELGTTHGGLIWVNLQDDYRDKLSTTKYQKSDIRRLNELATATVINGRLTKFRYYSDDVHSKDNQLHWKSVTNEELTKDDLIYLNQLDNLLQVDGDKITLVNWEY